MLDVAKMSLVLPSSVAADETDLEAMLAACDAHANRPLLFSYGGRTIQPGYHVTEVKAGAFAALDCGGNPEAWSEIFIQLWDVIDGDRTHMSAGKFAAIIRKVSEHVALDGSARLTFEVSDGQAPMELHWASVPTPNEDMLRVELAARVASCKPRDRWLEEQQKAAACCGPINGKQPCCGRS